MMTTLLRTLTSSVTNVLIKNPSIYQSPRSAVLQNSVNSVRRAYVVTSPALKTQAEMVDVVFVRADGSEIAVKGKIGDNLLDVVVNNNVDLDGFGACEGTLSCSTCHLIFKKEDYDKIEEKVTDEEMDMLDLAYGLCETSRLGCQVCLTKKLAGVKVQVPAGVHDVRS